MYFGDHSSITLLCSSAFFLEQESRHGEVRATFTKVKDRPLVEDVLSKISDDTKSVDYEDLPYP